MPAKWFNFHATLSELNEFGAFEQFLRPTRKVDCVVCAKRPFHGPKAVLDYLSRYTHRVAIANSRLVSIENNQVSFKWKDYRLEGRKRFSTMTLSSQEFLRRFLIHILPSRFHRIRHYGFLSNTVRAEKLQKVRDALNIAAPEPDVSEENDSVDKHLSCKLCTGAIQLIEVFEGTLRARAPPLMTTT